MSGVCIFVAALFVCHACKSRYCVAVAALFQTCSELPICCRAYVPIISECFSGFFVLYCVVLWRGFVSVVVWVGVPALDM